MIIMKKLVTVLATLSLTGMFGARVYHRVMAAGVELNQGRLFHDVPRGKSVSFVARGASDFHLVTYYVLDPKEPTPSRYTLNVAFLAADGEVREHRQISLSVGSSTAVERLQDGAVLAPSRLVRLLSPPDITVLRISSPDGRILLRADRLASSRATPAELMMRIGRPPAWFAADELQALLIHRWAALPVPDELPGVRLPPLAPVDAGAIPDDGLQDPARMTAGPHRALVFNAIGPGKVALTLPAVGQFQIEHNGAADTGLEQTRDGRMLLHLGPGPSSIAVVPVDGASGVVKIESSEVRALGRSDSVFEPAVRRASAWLADGEHAIKFPMYGVGGRPGPVRLTARALDVGVKRALRWRFLDPHGQELLTGTLPLEDSYDPFAGVERGGHTVDVGIPSRTLLMPPADTAALEISATGTLVELDTLLESGALPQPMPPFDLELPKELRWQDVPVQGPRWVMLRPLATESERRHLYATLLRMPRIERSGPPEQGPFVSLEPHHARKAHITEVTESSAPDQDVQTLPLRAHDTRILVEPTGKNARRIVLTCEVDAELGGKIAMRVDGHRAASTRVTNSTVRLEASASPGIHRVRVKGTERGRCTLAARPADGAVTVRRAVYQFPSSKGLNVELKTHDRPVRVHYALYAENEEAQKGAELAIAIDGGAPVRTSGSYTTLTASRTTQLVRAAGTTVPTYGTQAKRTLYGVGVSAVQLGDELPPGRHRITLRALTPGRYWARFWIEGKRHREELAESFVTTEADEAGEEE